MATIVQPYNPWREQLAANILGPLVGGMIQRGQEAEQNRKMNALRGELNRRMTETPDSLTAALATDPADALPQTPKLGGAANPQQVLAELMATPRFGMLSPKAVDETLHPYLADYEKMKREAALAEMANAVTEAGSDTERRNALWRGVLNGYADPALLGTMQKQYEYDNPYLQRVTTDTGGSVIAENWDPRTGQTAGSTVYPRTMSPEAASRDALAWAQYSSANDHWDKNFAASEDERMYKRNNPKGDYVSDAEGNVYNRQGNNATPVMTADGSPLKLNPKQTATGGKMSEYDKARLKAIHDRSSAIDGELAKIDEYVAWSDDEGKKAQQLALRDRLNAEKAQLEYEEWAIGMREDPDNPVLRQQAAQNGWTYGGTRNETGAAKTTETPESMIADVSNDPAQVMPQTPATPPAPVVPQGTASADVAPQTGQTVGVDVAPPTKAEYEAMCRKYGKDVVDEAMRRDGVAIPR